MIKIIRSMLFLGLALLVISIIVYLFNLPGLYSVYPVLLVASLICIAISFQGYKNLKGFSYTIFIIMGICLGMFFPNSFVRWGDFELKKLIVPFVQVTMLGYGCTNEF